MSYVEILFNIFNDLTTNSILMKFASHTNLGCISNRGRLEG